MHLRRLQGHRISTRDPRGFSTADLAKLCCLLVFDCLVAAGLAGVNEFGPLRGLVFAILVAQPVLLFNWGLLVALSIARARVASVWPYAIAVALAAIAFAVMWPPVMRLVIYRPGSAAAADCLASPSPWAVTQLAATALFWLWARKPSAPGTEEPHSAQFIQRTREHESPQ